MSEKVQVLVRQTLAGDNEAFGTLVDQYSGLVYSLVLEVVRRPEDVQDLVQETFCKAYQQLPRLRRPASFPSWLAQIAHHTALSWLRQEKSRHQVEASIQNWILPVSPPPPDRQVEEHEHADLLWRLLDRLPVAQRRAVVLFYLEGCTYREIAPFLGKSVATVRWYLFQAERRLGQELALRLGEERKKERPDRRRLREKVLASLPIGMGAYSRAKALPWSPLGDQLKGFSTQGLLATCFLGSVLLHLLGVGALKYGWSSAEGPASGFSLLLEEQPQARALPVSSFAGEVSGQPNPGPNSSPAVQEVPPAKPAAEKIPSGAAPPLTRPWQPSASAAVLAEMAAQVVRERSATDAVELPRLEGLEQTALSPAEPAAAIHFDSLSSQYERSGQFQALVRYENPADPQSIQGFVHLGQIQSLRVNQAGASGAGTDTGEQLRQLDGLVNALETFTQIKADLAPSLTFADPRLLDLPIVLPLSLPNEAEMEHLSRYLMEGGFILNFGAQFESYREGLEKYGHLVWGQDVWTEYLDEGHPLFSAYFPLRGVPRTEQGLVRKGDTTQSGALPGGSPRLRQDRMLGLFVKGRLAGVEFYMPPRRAGRTEEYEDTAQSQLAVNIVVYALTQEGSLTRRRAPAFHMERGPQ